MRLADKFNRAKTREIDCRRMQNISAPLSIPKIKIHHSPPFNQKGMLSFPGMVNPFAYQSTVSHTLLMPLLREKEDPPLVKVSFKDVPIPPFLPTDAFDLTGCKISTLIPMQLLLKDEKEGDGDEEGDGGDIFDLKRKGVKTLVHVYQEVYADEVNATGFGDFVRSCYFVLQFSRTHGFHHLILIAHPVAIWLENYGEKALGFASEFVEMFALTNWSHSLFDKNQCLEEFVLVEEREKEYIEYLNKLPVCRGGVVWSYHILFPYGSIEEEDKELVKVMLQPSQEMKQYVDQKLADLQLEVQGYVVIHIRSGDAHLLHGSSEFGEVYIDVMKEEIDQVLFHNKERKVLLIADNNDIKVLLQTMFPDRIVCLFQEITHLGEGSALAREKVKNTLLDFYLMSHAHSILSFTTYPHGSGFSYWCAVTYGIPYRSRYIAN